MVIPSVGAIVLAHFPFSDLSRSKLRPAVVLADTGRSVGFYVKLQVSPTQTRLPSKLQTAICRAAHSERIVTPVRENFSQQMQQL